MRCAKLEGFDVDVQSEMAVGGIWSAGTVRQSWRPMTTEMFHAPVVEGAMVSQWK